MTFCNAIRDDFFISNPGTPPDLKVLAKNFAVNLLNFFNSPSASIHRKGNRERNNVSCIHYIFI